MARLVCNDFLYTSPVANMGEGPRQSTINKEMLETPAPNNYEQRKNDKIAGPHAMRDKIKKRAKLERERMPRLAKDRPEDWKDMVKWDHVPESGQSYQVGGAPKRQDRHEPRQVQLTEPENVYTFGMEDRDKKLESDGPGPGQYEVVKKMGKTYSKRKDQGLKEPKQDKNQTGANSYDIVIKSRAPKYSFGSKPGVTLLGKGQFKSMRPGPGAYEDKDVQFKKPTTKFAKAGKQSLAKINGVPGPDMYNPSEVKLNSDKYSFPKAERLDETSKASHVANPGPGHYDLLNKLPPGQAKSMLGGSIEEKKQKDNGVPGPGNYFDDINKGVDQGHIPTITYHKMPERFIERKKEEGKSNVFEDDKRGPPSKMMAGYSIGNGLRDPSEKVGPDGQKLFKDKFTTPAPNAYNVSEDANKKFKFHMGMRTNYKANAGQDTPAPGSHLMNNYEPIGPSHLIGTGNRSDLGVGKARLAPGPGQYNIRGAIEGPQIKFGNELKVTSIEKTYEPGPGSYNLPGTVGNIPKYLRVKEEMEHMRMLADDKSEDMNI